MQSTDMSLSELTINGERKGAVVCLFNLLLRLAQILRGYLQNVAAFVYTKGKEAAVCLFHLLLRLAQILRVDGYLQNVILVISWLAGYIRLQQTPVVRVFVLVLGNTLGCHERFLELLSPHVTLVRGHSPEDSDVILAFCPIVSRVGTDIGAALNKIPEYKPAVLVVFHHTFDKDYVIPNTGRFTTERRIPTVDCLFSDSGLLATPQHDKAVEDMLTHLKPFQGSKRGRHV
ncbi:uncharacterized protein LOC134469420 [Engraulis encrasicolus]|uniref:uncharacterized protein LOC134469420 n=1 Tax=Engraulis encrasicolus TaxID=184585 RepID=UPI002FCE726B